MAKNPTNTNPGPLKRTRPESASLPRPRVGLKYLIPYIGLGIFFTLGLLHLTGAINLQGFFNPNSEYYLHFGGITPPDEDSGNTDGTPDGTGGQDGNVASGGAHSEKWEGTYTASNVYGACTTGTTAKMSICMTQEGQNLEGIITFQGGFKDTITKGDPYEICMDPIHCTGDDACNHIKIHIDSSGSPNVDFLTLDGIGYFYSDDAQAGGGSTSATITGGNSMNVQFSKSILSGLGSTMGGSFTVTKVSDDCNYMW